MAVYTYSTSAGTLTLYGWKRTGTLRPYPTGWESDGSNKRVGCSGSDYSTLYGVGIATTSALNITAPVSSITLTVTINSNPYKKRIMVSAKRELGTSSYAHCPIMATSVITQSATSFTVNLTRAGVCPYGYFLFLNETHWATNTFTVTGATLTITTDPSSNTFRYIMDLNAWKTNTSSTSQVKEATLQYYTTDATDLYERRCGASGSYATGYACRASWPTWQNTSLINMIKSLPAGAISSIKLIVEVHNLGYTVHTRCGLLANASSGVLITSASSMSVSLNAADRDSYSRQVKTFSPSTSSIGNTAFINAYGYAFGGTVDSASDPLVDSLCVEITINNTVRIVNNAGNELDPYLVYVVNSAGTGLDAYNVKVVNSAGTALDTYK